MKSYVNWSFAYALLGMAAGVFYREFTKINAFQGVTTLGKVHTHTLVLGMLFFLLVLLLNQHFHLNKHKYHSLFMKLYNAGVLFTITMMIIRGITQVLAVPLSSGMDAAISGLSGIGHILTGTGIILFFIILRASITSNDI